MEVSNVEKSLWLISRRQLLCLVLVSICNSAAVFGATPIMRKANPFVDGRAVVETFDPITNVLQWAFISKSGEILLTFPKDVSPISIVEQPVFPAQAGGRCGYLTTTGAWLKTPEFDKCHPFYERGSLAAVKKSDKWAYINYEGKIITEFVFDAAQPFIENRALVLVSGYWGVISPTGDFVIKPRLLGEKGSDPFFPSNYSNGLLRYTAGNKTVFYNLKGEVALQFDSSGVSDFSDGIATAMYKGTNNIFSGEAKYFIDKSGKQIFKNKKIRPYTGLSIKFREGLGFADEKKSGKLVVVDRNGDIKCRPKAYSAVNEFRNGFAIVNLGAHHQRSGILNSKCQVIYEWSWAPDSADYDASLGNRFSEGLLPVCSKSKDSTSCAYINEKGAFQIGP